MTKTQSPSSPLLPVARARQLPRRTTVDETATRLTAVVVLVPRLHIAEVFADGVDDVAELVVEAASAHDVAGVLDREFDFRILVPIGIHVEFPLPDPPGVVFDDAFDLKVMRNVELGQSDPDCKEFVASLRVEPDLAAQILHGLFLYLDDVFPTLVVAQEHAVVLAAPALAAVCPVGPDEVQNLP